MIIYQARLGLRSLINSRICNQKVSQLTISCQYIVPKFHSTLSNVRMFNIDSNTALSNNITACNMTFKRFKTKGKKTQKVIVEKEDEEDSDDEDDETNPLLKDDNDDGNNEADGRTILIEVGSSRLDVVAKAGFSTSRQKIEEHFYKSELYVNREKPSKKSINISINDEIDIIKGINEDNKDMVDIKRIHVIDLPDKIISDRLKIKLQRWDNLTVPAYRE